MSIKDIKKQLKKLGYETINLLFSPNSNSYIVQKNSNTWVFEVVYFENGTIASITPNTNYIEITAKNTKYNKAQRLKAPYL